MCVFDQFQIFHNLGYLRIYEYLIIYQFSMNLQIIVILDGFIQFIWALVSSTNWFKIF